MVTPLPTHCSHHSLVLSHQYTCQNWSDSDPIIGHYGMLPWQVSDGATIGLCFHSQLHGKSIWGVYRNHTAEDIWIDMEWNNHAHHTAIRDQGTILKKLTSEKDIHTYFNVWVRYFVWNLKGYLWNSTQSTLSFRYQLATRKLWINSLRPSDVYMHR